jgi:hypothetical protein
MHELRKPKKIRVVIRLKNGNEGSKYTFSSNFILLLHLIKYFILDGWTIGEYSRFNNITIGGNIESIVRLEHRHVKQSRKSLQLILEFYVVLLDWYLVGGM